MSTPLPFARASVSRAQVVAEAISWLGTPYHHCADIKGVGVDCGMILVQIFCGLGLVPPFDPRPYKPEFFMHRDEPFYLNWLQTYGHQVEVAQAGDIDLFNFGRHPAHAGIVVNDHAMVHAYKPAGRVIMDDRKALKPRFHSSWSVF